MAGGKWYTTNKCFSLKLCKKKKEIKKPKTNNKTIAEKSEKEKKMRQNENRKKCVKKICQCNYEKKRFIQSFKPRKEILKLKIKIKNIQ